MDYRKEARSGEAMLNLAESEDFRIFRAEILDVIKEDAFKIFTDSPADDTIAIVGAQQMNKVIDRIDILMIDLVERGRHALSQLKDSNHEEDGGIS